MTLKNVDDFIYKDDETETNALHIACSTSSPIRDQVVVLLVRLNANINYPAKVDQINNMTALHLATINGYHSTIEILLNLGANVDLPDSTELTSYCYATRFRSESAELLKCFRSDFPSSLKVIKLSRESANNNNDQTFSRASTPKRGDKSMTNGKSAKHNEKRDTVIHHNNHTSSHREKKDSTSTTEVASIRSESGEPEILFEKTPPKSKTNEVVSSSNSVPKIKLKRKFANGKLMPITGEVRRIYDHVSAKANTPGFFVTLKDCDEKIKVGFDDLSEHAPYKLKCYLWKVRKGGGQKWRRVKEGFGQVVVQKALLYRV